MDSDQIETWDSGLEIDDLWHCQPEVCCLSITEEGICKELGDEWPGRGDKTRQAFRALLNSELPLAIPTWSSVNLINTARTGRTPSSREKSRAPMIFKLKTSRQHRASHFIISCKRNPAMTEHDWNCSYTSALIRLDEAWIVPSCEGGKFLYSHFASLIFC